MREFTRGLARTLAYIYCFVIKHKCACVAAALAVILLAPSVFYGLQRMIKVQAVDEIVLDDVVQLEEARFDILSGLICVMVDAGHGGKDPGANYGEIYEKDITLAVAKKVKTALEGHGIKVIMTREDDSFVNIYDRARAANDQAVDLFVSIHVNDLKQTGPSGIETYAGHWKRGGNILAQCILEGAVNASGANNLGVHFADYVVVKHTKMPAALIETGYMSNEEERAKLQSNAYQQMLADGIVDGILEYVNTQMGRTEQ